MQKSYYIFFVHGEGIFAFVSFFPPGFMDWWFHLFSWIKCVNFECIFQKHNHHNDITNSVKLVNAHNMWERVVIRKNHKTLWRLAESDAMGYSSNMYKNRKCRNTNEPQSTLTNDQFTVDRYMPELSDTNIRIMILIIMDIKIGSYVCF